MPYVCIMDGPSLTLPGSVIAVKIHHQSCNGLPYGGFPMIHHNEIRDLTASLITEVCPNVAIKQHLATTTVLRNP